MLRVVFESNLPDFFLNDFHRKVIAEYRHKLRCRIKTVFRGICFVNHLNILGHNLAQLLPMSFQEQI